MRDVLSYFRYNVEYGYDFERNCSEYGCDEEGICRCGRINSATVTNLNVDAIAENILFRAQRRFCGSQLSRLQAFNVLDVYALNRMLVHTLKAYDVDSWEVEVSAGYYGDEVTGVVLFGLNDVLVDFFKAKDSQVRLAQALDAEYGVGVLAHQRFDGLTFNVASVKFSDVRFGNPTHALCAGRDDKFSLSADISGVAVLENSDIVLVDGYHRFTHLHGMDSVSLLVAS